MLRLLDSGLTDPEFETFLGLDAIRMADIALTATAVAAIATIPAVFFSASKSAEWQVIGDVLFCDLARFSIGNTADDPAPPRLGQRLAQVSQAAACRDSTCKSIFDVGYREI